MPKSSGCEVSAAACLRPPRPAGSLMRAFLWARRRLTWLAAVLILSATSAAAHSFNVALLVPLSGAGAAAGSQMQDGFMLATRERDSHADQESDGHLGGLDVYVYPADSEGADAGEIGRMLQSRDIDIVAIAAPGEAFDRIAKLAGDAASAVIRVTEGVPLSQGGSEAADPTGAAGAFIEAFRSAYGYSPTLAAAQGYQVARRVDQAVRAEAGVDDKLGLAARFRESEVEFAW